MPLVAPVELVALIKPMALVALMACLFAESADVGHANVHMFLERWERRGHDDFANISQTFRQVFPHDLTHSGTIEFRERINHAEERQRSEDALEKRERERERTTRHKDELKRGDTHLTGGCLAALAKGDGVVANDPTAGGAAGENHQTRSTRLQVECSGWR